MYKRWRISARSFIFKGVNPTLEKLPYDLWENWIAVGSKYEENNEFPPFHVLFSYVRQTKIRSGLSFLLAPGNWILKTERFTPVSNRAPVNVTKLMFHKNLQPSVEAQTRKWKLTNDAKYFLKSAVFEDMKRIQSEIY